VPDTLRSGVQHRLPLRDLTLTLPTSARQSLRRSGRAGRVRKPRDTAKGKTPRCRGTPHPRPPQDHTSLARRTNKADRRNASAQRPRPQSAWAVRARPSLQHRTGRFCARFPSTLLWRAEWSKARRHLDYSVVDTHPLQSALYLMGKLVDIHLTATIVEIFDGSDRYRQPQELSRTKTDSPRGAQHIDAAAPAGDLAGGEFSRRHESRSHTERSCGGLPSRPVRKKTYA